MDKKQGLKRKAKTQQGQRIYATPQSTLINHPTRLKILESLSPEKAKTTRQLESITKENRFNLYYHLNLLEVEGLLSVSTQNREKQYTLNEQNLKTKILNLRLQIPQDPIKRKLFLTALEELITRASKTVPIISKSNLKTDKVAWISMQFEQDQNDI